MRNRSQRWSRDAAVAFVNVVKLNLQNSQAGSNLTVGVYVTLGAAELAVSGSVKAVPACSFR